MLKAMRFGCLLPIPGLLLLMLLFPTWVRSVDASEQDRGIDVRITPNPVINGHVALLEVKNRPDESVIVGIQVKVKDKLIPVYEHPFQKDVYIGLIGISYYRQPGEYPLLLEWTDRQGYHQQPFFLKVAEGRFKSEKLKVAPKKVSPPEEERIRIREQQSQVQSVYRFSHAFPVWDTPFQRPISGAVTSPFGTRRTYNRKLKSYHNGVDFRAATGSPIYAANSGIIKFASELFYSGNTVIIDHGKGLFTIYAHLSRISVSIGQRVEKGEEIGLAGSTGRSNGPHLHWGAKLNGTYVDPLDLLDTINALFIKRNFAASDGSE